mmetsp:Transcript_54866/g.158742  ORF Transcript_54866/g.158742 Transcript_54866/m.158742 type:complete len:205 (-) Transcript_54866:114-728(-)
MCGSSLAAFAAGASERIGCRCTRAFAETDPRAGTVAGHSSPSGSGRSTRSAPGGGCRRRSSGRLAPPSAAGWPPHRRPHVVSFSVLPRRPRQTPRAAEIAHGREEQLRRHRRRNRQLVTPLRRWQSTSECRGDRFYAKVRALHAAAALCPCQFPCRAVPRPLPHRPGLASSRGGSHWHGCRSSSSSREAGRSRAPLRSLGTRAR